MARFAPVLAAFFLVAPGLAEAQIADAATARSELDALQHESEGVYSGLADVRRHLRGLGIYGLDEMGSARLVLTFEDHFGGLAPVSATFALDGARLFTSMDAAQIESGAIYAGPVPSGPHVLTMELRYRGDVLYTTGYRTTITSSYAFGTSLDRTTHLRVIGHDTSVFAAPADRWTVDYATETDPRE